MHANRCPIAICSLVTALFAPVVCKVAGGAASQARSPSAADPVKVLVGRLDLERYKATIKALTQFGDRLEGTDRNRAAID